MRIKFDFTLKCEPGKDFKSVRFTKTISHEPEYALENPLFKLGAMKIDGWVFFTRKPDYNTRELIPSITYDVNEDCYIFMRRENITELSRFNEIIETLTERGWEKQL